MVFIRYLILNKVILSFYGNNFKHNIMAKEAVDKGNSEKEAKLKALQLTLDKLDKTYGKGTVMKMGDKAIVEVETISSGSLGVDLALGVNGYPRGRVI